MSFYILWIVWSFTFEVFFYIFFQAEEEKRVNEGEKE